MTLVSNDPSWWPMINLNILNSYWIVAAGIVVLYDWVLTLGQEIELIWRQRWSSLTVLYLIIRYIGLPYSVVSILRTITGYALNGTNVIIPAMLGVIMIARLHAMYQGSKTILIFLVIIFLAINIGCGVLMAIALKYIVTEELILSGTYMCNYGFEGDAQLLISMLWMLNTVWEVLALCLSVWIVVKHFLELRRFGLSTGSIIGDCFRVLIKSHVLYFVSFACVSCLQLFYVSPEIAANIYSIDAIVLYCTCQILFGVQMFVLGPRLILSVREYHAKLVAESDAETSMNSIVFQKHVHITTSNTV
ncbi:uncharacterized protein HD556DRAFT_1461574 [Suillus plorans]|uniref:DUF6533 domain-containing protein n=1 Tax=Suillus plorans TaxID=116603 RepID=A0A9P7DMA1_9AGAM|nr:uncharacterized protein HD556DRAFT_1461574 [Suillus plorans]KAG1798420.1 hypothetical protein HD556DRAFT_1461574 [Suillus plorans]